MQFHAFATQSNATHSNSADFGRKRASGVVSVPPYFPFQHPWIQSLESSALCPASSNPIVISFFLITFRVASRLQNPPITCKSSWATRFIPLQLGSWEAPHPRTCLPAFFLISGRKPSFTPFAFVKADLRMSEVIKGSHMLHNRDIRIQV